MKFAWLGALMLLLTCNAMGLDEKFWNEATSLREQGEFAKATRFLQAQIDESSPTLSPDDKRAVEFEIERIRRIRMDYTLTREKLLEQLRKRVLDLSEEEFDRYEQEGNLDVLVIDGQKFYVNTSASNLLLRVSSLRARRTDRKPDTAYQKLYTHMARVKKAQQESSDLLLFPQDFLVTYTLIVNPNAAPEGQVIRCWLPFARSIPSQTDIVLLRTEPDRPVVSNPQALHRTIYFERAAVKDSPTTFSVSFVYRCWSRVSQVDPAAVLPYRSGCTEVQFYASEKKPHIDFGNEELKRLNADIINGETNPYRIARRIYDWIAQNCIYQYAREYSTIENLSYYTASRKAGDCGQHGMLFIALCRMNGIPARWATGWESFNTKGLNMHDWCEFFVEPYGWLAADPDMALNVLKYSQDELTTSQSQELADWLFGNMDHFRLTVNGDFSAPLFPPKNDFRSETVDFQRGEVEVGNQNLYFDQWDYTMRIRPISSHEAEALRTSKVIPEQVQITYPEFTTATVATTQASSSASLTSIDTTTETVSATHPTTSTASSTSTEATTETAKASATTAPVLDLKVTTETKTGDLETTAPASTQPNPPESAEQPKPVPADAATTTADQQTTPTVSAS